MQNCYNVEKKNLVFQRPLVNKSYQELYRHHLLFMCAKIVQYCIFIQLLNCKNVN